LETIKKWFKSWSGRSSKRPSETERARFTLAHHGTPIGRLSLDHGTWKFAYSDQFRSAKKLRPLLEFPDVEKVYESPDLWATFETRIPSTKQPRVREIMLSKQVEEEDTLKLLRLFGQHTASSPFELVETNED